MRRVRSYWISYKTAAKVSPDNEIHGDFMLITSTSGVDFCSTSVRSDTDDFQKRLIPGVLTDRSKCISFGIKTTRSLTPYSRNFLK